VHLSEIPALFRNGTLPLDVALIHVSRPDEHGFMSYGVECLASKSAAENAKLVVAQVNESMPERWEMYSFICRACTRSSSARIHC